MSVGLSGLGRFGATLLLGFALCHCRKRPPTIVDVQLGPAHACAREDSGKVWCWGGEHTPKPVAEADVVAVGADSVCFLQKGAVTCRKLDGLYGPSAGQLVPVKVGATKIKAAGGLHCLEYEKNVLCTHTPEKVESWLTAASNVVDWAVGASGLYYGTGDGVFGCEAPAACKPVPALSGARSFAIGKSHVCAVSAERRVICVGDNARGQLGGEVPAGKLFATVAELTDVVELSAGDFFTCARMADRTISCWGDNTSNQLARSGVLQSMDPVPVYGVLGAVRLSSQGNGTCVALGPEEGVRCFGGAPRSRYGVPGDSTAPLNVPMPVRFPKQ
jgi:Regulator of chromosome condensation (RCC1) repeat